MIEVLIKGNQQMRKKKLKYRCHACGASGFASGGHVLAHRIKGARVRADQHRRKEAKERADKVAAFQAEKKKTFAEAHMADFEAKTGHEQALLDQQQSLRQEMELLNQKQRTIERQYIVMRHMRDAIDELLEDTRQ